MLEENDANLEVRSAFAPRAAILQVHHGVTPLRPAAGSGSLEPRGRPDIGSTETGATGSAQDPRHRRARNPPGFHLHPAVAAPIAG